MKLIITRPLDDALPLARKLEERGHEPLLAPLLGIVPRGDAMVPDARFQAICVTSANGLQRPDVFHGLHRLPLYCVGPQSAEAARKAGFSDVRERGGNVEGLCAAISTELDSTRGPLLYASGNETSGDLEGSLTRSGFKVHRTVVYDAVKVPLSLTRDELLGADGVLLYSPRSARLWVEALAAVTGERKAPLMHFCLSQNVARALSPDSRFCVAEQADEAHMMTLLDRASEQE